MTKKIHDCVKSFPEFTMSTVLCMASRQSTDSCKQSVYVI